MDERGDIERLEVQTREPKSDYCSTNHNLEFPAGLALQPKAWLDLVTKNPAKPSIVVVCPSCHPLHLLSFLSS